MKGGEPELAWVKAPRQDRSKRTLEKLLDAAEHIIRTEGPAALTVPAVVRAARSSTGSFYARFPDKASLLRTLHDRASADTLTTAEEALDPARWEGVPTATLLRSFVRFLVRLSAERRPMMLAFHAELGADRAFAERRAKAAAGIARAVKRLFASRRRDLAHPHPDRAVEMSLRLVTSVLEQRNALDLAGVEEVLVSDEILIEELTRAVTSYLGVRG